jgi:hypothetical protein
MFNDQKSKFQTKYAASNTLSLWNENLTGVLITGFGHCNFEFGIYLGFGACILVFHYQTH